MRNSDLCYSKWDPQNSASPQTITDPQEGAYQNGNQPITERPVSSADFWGVRDSKVF